MAYLCVRYFVEASFIGTDYVGWQRQPNGLSVQEVIENSISMSYRQTEPPWRYLRWRAALLRWTRNIFNWKGKLIYQMGGRSDPLDERPQPSLGALDFESRCELIENPL